MEAHVHRLFQSCCKSGPEMPTRVQSTLSGRISKRGSGSSDRRSSPFGAKNFDRDVSSDRAEMLRIRNPSPAGCEAYPTLFGALRGGSGSLGVAVGRLP